MSDSLKGLGDIASAYLPRHKSGESQSAPSASKTWGGDGYSPTSNTVRTMSIMQQTVTARLQASFATPNEQASDQATAATSKNTYSPENVAQRILSHVGNYLERLQEQGASDERLGDVFEIAKSSVQKGIEDANEKLKALGWLNESVEKGIEETQSLISEGFDSLEDFFLGAKGVSTVEQVSSTSYSRQDAASFELVTQEGDRVNVSMYSLQASESAESSISSGDNNANFLRYQSQTQAFAFDFSVEGDLSDIELKAINDMMNAAGQVSDLFFSGDVMGALQKGFDKGFDASALASFSMSLQTQQTIKSTQAVSAYDQNTGMRSIQEPLAEYRETLETMAEKASEIFDDFQAVVDTVLSEIMKMREQQSDKLENMQQAYQYQQEMMSRISQLFLPEQFVNNAEESPGVEPAAS